MSFVYLDTSVALAQLLAEDRLPPDGIWAHPLISSRLLEYELWTRIHARKLARSHGDLVRGLVNRVSLLELVSPVLERGIEPFPVSVRTLDSLHLASLCFLKRQVQQVRLASYDSRLVEAAVALDIEIYALS